MFDKIKDYRSVSLDEIKAIKLMNRIDTKYLVAKETIIRLLDELADDYSVLEVASKRYGQYDTVYYDTADFRMFHAHVTARYPRFKVRKRTYSQNGLQFLEVKRKKINGNTSKKRLPVENETGLDDRFVADHCPFRTDDLQPLLINQFNRITLVNRERTERLTLDFDLQFRTLDGAATPVFNQGVIIELKQDKKADSVIARRLRDENIRPCGVSKYCVGMLLLYKHLSFKKYKINFVKFLHTAQWNYSI
jgi:hypothetical protein